MRDGVLLTVDEQDILQRAEEIAHRVWRQLRETYPDVTFPVQLADGPAF